MTHWAIRMWILLAAPLAFSVSAGAQTLPIDPGARQAAEVARSHDEGLGNAAQTTNLGAGEVGQRQTREDAAPNVQPLGRIDNRIQNRIQNRLQNRIDRDYDPIVNATSPFDRADDRARDRGSPRPR